MNSIDTDEPPRGLDQHAMTEIIKSLQDNPATTQEALFRIEWAYLPLLDHDLGSAPRTLELRLATDPSFFCEIIALVFRSEKDDWTKQDVGEKGKRVAQNAYRLLHEWQKVPGRSPDGAFNGDAFSKWLEEVSHRTKESGHYMIAMEQIGQVLPHSPPDPNGLWIHCAVAEALDKKDAREMRSGFTCKLFNMRGVHGFTAGKEEREIARRYREQAEALEGNGFPRFAAAMRKLAKGYERAADQESKRDPFED